MAKATEQRPKIDMILATFRWIQPAKGLECSAKQAYNILDVLVLHDVSARFGHCDRTLMHPASISKYQYSIHCGDTWDKLPVKDHAEIIVHVQITSSTHQLLEKIMQRFQTLERGRRHQDGTVNLEPRAPFYNWLCHCKYHTSTGKTTKNNGSAYNPTSNSTLCFNIINFALETLTARRKHIRLTVL